MKKLFSIILVAVILMCPVSVFAYTRVPISSVGIEIKSDISGLTAKDYQEFITIHDENVAFLWLDSDPPVTVTTADGTKYNRPFVAGEKYNVSVCVAPKEDLFCFSPVYLRGVTVIGENAELVNYTLTVLDGGMTYLTINAEITVDELDFFESIAKKFSDFFEKIREFFMSFLIR